MHCIEIGQSHNSALLLSSAEVLILSLTSTDFLELNLDKAFQLILHFFARISAQALVFNTTLSANRGIF